MPYKLHGVEFECNSCLVDIGGRMGRGYNGIYSALFEKIRVLLINGLICKQLCKERARFSKIAILSNLNTAGKLLERLCNCLRMAEH